jgi:hypothetical protein
VAVLTFYHALMLHPLMRAYIRQPHKLGDGGAVRMHKR